MKSKKPTYAELEKSYKNLKRAYSQYKRRHKTPASFVVSPSAESIAAALKEMEDCYWQRIINSK